MVRLLEVMVIVFLVTLPFGFYRTRTRKFSARWFLAIHLPVPLVFLTRYEAHLSYAFIPFTCLAFTAGQLLGGKAGRWWTNRRAAGRTDENPSQQTEELPGPASGRTP
jgi:hypothetical protein